MKRLKFYGLGGQGVVTAGKVLSSAVSLHEDKYAITVPAYGHERRGAPVFTDVVMDDKPVLVNCFVYTPDIVVVMDETIIQKHVDVSKGITNETILVLNASSEAVARKYQEALDNIGKGIPNGSTLGALAKTGVVSIESVEKALIEFFGEKAGAKNAKAARDSYNQTRQM